jgi:hypothetical protein
MRQPGMARLKGRATALSQIRHTADPALSNGALFSLLRRATGDLPHWLHAGSRCLPLGGRELCNQLHKSAGMAMSRLQAGQVAPHPLGQPAERRRLHAALNLATIYLDEGYSRRSAIRCN